MYKRIGEMSRVIVTAQVSSTLQFAFVSPEQILDAKLVVFAFDDDFHFGFQHESAR